MTCHVFKMAVLERAASAGIQFTVSNEEYSDPGAGNEDQPAHSFFSICVFLGYV